MVIDFSDGADVVLARPEIADVAALRGKRVGVTISPLDIYLLTRVLEIHGLTLKDVSLVYLRTMDMPDALRSGKVDAITSYPPNSSEMEAAGIARAIFDSRQLPGEILDVLALDEEVIRKRPKDVAALIRAFHRAVKYEQEHPEEAWRIMAERERISPESFRQALHSGITMVTLAQQQNFLGADSSLPGTVTRISEILHDQGQLTKAGYESDLLNNLPSTLAASP
jgi:NitT/TauT family transport system substrate-binding protein